MMKTRVYLDNCCLNRPFDDALTPLIRLEVEAKNHIQRQILDGNIELAWSFILDHENGDNPYEERREAIAPWKCQAVVNIDVSEEVILRAFAIAKLGIRGKDSLHVSCAIQAKCRYFLTTDKGILKKRVEGITLLNPVDYIQEVEG
jgi:predicted nucleic acid-binding protein